MKLYSATDWNLNDDKQAFKKMIIFNLTYVILVTFLRDKRFSHANKNQIVFPTPCEITPAIFS